MADAIEAVPVGRMPAEFDARKVVELVLALPEGGSASYEVLAAAVGPELLPGTPRFWTVLNRARLLLRRVHNVECEVVRRVGLRRLPESERVVHAVRDAGRGVKAIAKAAGRAGAIRTEKLSEAEQRTVMHVQRVLEVVHGHAQSARREFGALLTPPQALPRGKNS